MKTKSEIQKAESIAWKEMDCTVEPAEKVPSFLKVFADKTPAQVLEKYIGLEKVEIIGGAVFGIADIGIALPDWVKNSSVQFWKNYGLSAPLKPRESAKDFGFLVKMFEIFARDGFIPQSQLSPPTALDKFMGKVSARAFLILTQKLVSGLSDEEKSQFYAGCVKGTEFVKKLDDSDYLKMVKRANVYIVIAGTWRKIEQFKTNADRERWIRIALIEEKRPRFKSDAEKEAWEQEKMLHPDKLSSREFYDIFKTVGLTGAAPGRPKKLET